MIIKDLLPSHQVIKNVINIPYNNIGELFYAKYQETPGKIFLICPGNNEDSVTFENFYKKNQFVSNYLIRLGLTKGDRFSLIFSNSLEFLLLYFAGLKLGIIVVPINPDIAPEEMKFVIEDSQSKVVFYQSELQYKIKRIVTEISPEIMFESMQFIPDFIPLLLNGVEIDESYIPSIELVDEAVIIYTSGTTGNPKGVVLSQLNLLADAKAIAEWFQFTPETRTLCILPLFIIMVKSQPFLLRFMPEVQL